MDLEELKLYQQQLLQVNQALSQCPEGQNKEELLTLKSSLEELLELTNENTKHSDTSNSNEEILEDEFAAFMAEMEKEGAVQKKNEKVEVLEDELDIDLKNIEGKKCRAPHQHQWGSTAYHNAMICSVDSNENELKVRVLFTNPTHQEMLPCPFYYTSECKFSEDQCRFSHGEVVLHSSLQEYIEPNFETLTAGSIVLAKQKNNLWYRAQIKRLYEQKCLVKFESDSKEAEVNVEHIFPLFNEVDENSDSDDIESIEAVSNQEDIINQSLMITPTSQTLGEWEQYTKGMGSKLMFKMGYIVGTGLGKNAEGRVDPVSAFIFPAGKSLDHCMNLRELSGGDKDLFSVEKKMKRLQRKQEIQSKKNYERQQKQQDIFDFINKSMHSNEENSNKSEIKQVIKKETNRNLNIKSVRIDEDIRKIEKELEHIRTSLTRHKDPTSEIYKKLRDRLSEREMELVQFRKQAQMVKNEQSLRNNKKKMTIF